MSDLAAMVLVYGVSATVSVALVGGFLLLRARQRDKVTWAVGAPEGEPIRWVYDTPKPPRLYQIAGLAAAPTYEVRDGGLEVECDEGTWRALQDAASLIARGGVALTPEWWAAQTPLERAALVDAQDRVWAARASAIGTAAQGRAQAAHVLSRADGGAAALRVELAEAALRGAREASGKDVTS